MPAQYPSIVPIGRLSITAAGTTTLLSANCGPYNGQVGGTWANPALAGSAWRYMELQADISNTGNLYLLPGGNTAAANPGTIIAKIAPGASLPLPTGIMVGNGFVPENFCLDTDAVSGTQLAYGFGSLG